jgi:hypothetical protein
MAAFQQTQTRQLATQPLSPQQGGATSGGIAHSPAPGTSGARPRDNTPQHRTRAAAKYSHFSELLTSQFMPAQQVAHTQKTEELDAASHKLSDRLAALPKRVQSHARSHAIPRTLATGTEKKESG